MKVFVECYHDAALVRALGIPSKCLGHSHGKGNVLSALAKWKGIAAGLIDADPGKQRSNPHEMEKYLEERSQHGLTLMRHRHETDKKLIVVNPALEQWLYLRIKSSGFKPQNYCIPDTPELMHRNPRCDKKPGFKKILSELAVLDEGFKSLKEWLIF